MNFNLREHAWMAPVGSFLVAILALLVAVISNKEKLKQVIKQRWVFVTVILGAALIGMCFLYGWLGWTVQLLNRPVTLRVWVLILLLILAAAVPMSILFLLAWITAPKEAREAPSPRQLTLQDYTQDEDIFGVKWSWSYIYGKMDPLSLTAFCPNCTNRLDTEDNWRRGRSGFIYPPITHVCTNCGFRREHQHQRMELTDRVMKEIERRINSGEFLQRLSSQGGSNRGSS